MAWAIITMYTSKCAQMDPQQLLETSKFYSRSKKCDIEKTLGSGYHPLGSPKVNGIMANRSEHLLTSFDAVALMSITFIHSFITEIYIAPLQGYYSEALPTLARLKRRVLRLE